MLAKNPIILATLAGGLVNGLGITVPAPLANGLDIVGGASLALGLVCVGGGLDFRWSSARPLALGATSALKLLALPLLAVLTCRLLGADDDVTRAACFYAALPTASNAYIMARQMGGDAPLMASLITLQTLLAVVTVPLALQLPVWLPG
nr:AEC family transporter [Luteimonas sp. BDR2-5]